MASTPGVEDIHVGEKGAGPYRLDQYERPITMEGIMDRVWLYLGGMAVAFGIAVYAVISIVKGTSPPAY